MYLLLYYIKNARRKILRFVIDRLINVVFRLGNDRYKTKTVYETLNPKWQEQFELYLYEDTSQELEITVWDRDQRSKDDFMGR